MSTLHDWRHVRLFMGAGASAGLAAATAAATPEELKVAFASFEPALKAKLKEALAVAPAPKEAVPHVPDEAAIARLGEQFKRSCPSPPVIFLDVDGVCHPLKPSGHPLYASMDDLTARTEAEIDLPDDATGSIVEGEFTHDCMSALQAFVKNTDARVVLSSTWRETGPQRRAVDVALKKAGIPPASGATPMRTLHDGGRVAEIMQWVDTQKPVRWLAIDDADLGKLPTGHFLQTDPGLGFTLKDVERAFELLQKQGQRGSDS